MTVLPLTSLTTGTRLQDRFTILEIKRAGRITSALSL